MRQEASSGEISSSVSTISEKAKKLRQEITTSLGRLVKAEEAAIEALSDVRSSGQPAAEMIALHGEAAAWKRRCAATLVGLAQPSPETQTCAGRRLAAWAASVSDPAIVNNPAFAELKSADEAAHAGIAKMMREIEQTRLRHGHAVLSRGRRQHRQDDRRRPAPLRRRSRSETALRPPPRLSPDPAER